MFLNPRDYYQNWIDHCTKTISVLESHQPHTTVQIDIRDMLIWSFRVSRSEHQRQLDALFPPT